MARLIDPPEDFNNHVNTPGVPPGPPEALKRANFSQQRFVVAVQYAQNLTNPVHYKNQSFIHSFYELFFGHLLVGEGFWTLGARIPKVRCAILRKEMECIELIWNYVNDEDSQNAGDEVSGDEQDDEDDYSYTSGRLVTACPLEEAHWGEYINEFFDVYPSQFGMKWHDYMLKLTGQNEWRKWQLYRLNNDGFYFAPTLKPTYDVSVEATGFHGTLSADATGVVVSIFAFDKLAIEISWGPHLWDCHGFLVEYAKCHPEFSQIRQATGKFFL